jgi:Bacterial Ig domain
VPAVNDPPQCFGLQQVAVEVGESGSGVPCIDPEGDNLTITITQQPAKGTLEIVDQGTPSPSLRYTATSVGPDRFSYKASDGSADSNLAATTTVNVDTRAPETTIDAGPAGATGDTTPTFEFSASETGSSFECSVDGGAFAPCSSPYTTPLLADGAHTFAVRAIDAAGNSDQSPAARSFTVSTGGGGGGSGTLDPIASPVIAGGASAGSAKVAANGLALLKTIVECRGAGPSCSVRTTVTARLRGNTFGAARTKTVKLGGSKFTIAAGKAARVKIKLSRKGLRLLKRRKRISAKVRINVARAGESTARTVKVTLKAPRRS